MMKKAQFKYLGLAAAMSVAWSLDALGQGAAGQPSAGQGGAASSTERAQPGGSAQGTQAGGGTEAKLSSRDKRWIEDAARANVAEIEIGKLAASKAASDEVKQFASQMVKDHTTASEELQRIASGKGVTLPTDLDGAHKRELKALDKLSGAEFDRRFMARAGVAEHQKTVKLFQNEAKNGKDPELKAFAAKTLPVIEQHLQMARQMAPGKGGSGKPGSSPGAGSGSPSGSSGSATPSGSSSGSSGAGTTSGSASGGTGAGSASTGR